MPPVRKMVSQTSTISRQKSEVKPVIEISQRKELFAKLRQLPKEELTQLAAKINEGE